MAGADTILLGLVQGITEFLPVSSSGHLALTRIFLGIEEPSLAYDLVLHVATMLATLIYFARDLAVLFCEWICAITNRNARKWDGWRLGWGVVVGTLVTAPLGLFLKKLAEEISMNSLWVSCGLLITGLLLLSSKCFHPSGRSLTPLGGAVIGLAQGVSVLPGISRSGSTIWMGLLLGYRREEAFRFSFLLSIPAILGATLLQAREVGGMHLFIEALPTGWYWGAIVSFSVGYFSLILLKRLIINARWWYFGVYTLVLGSATLFSTLLNIGGW